MLTVKDESTPSAQPNTGGDAAPPEGPPRHHHHHNNHHHHGHGSHHHNHHRGHRDGGEASSGGNHEVSETLVENTDMLGGSCAQSETNDQGGGGGDESENENNGNEAPQGGEGSAVTNSPGREDYDIESPATVYVQQPPPIYSLPQGSKIAQPAVGSAYGSSAWVPAPPTLTLASNSPSPSSYPIQASHLSAQWCHSKHVHRGLVASTSPANRSMQSMMNIPYRPSVSPVGPGSINASSMARISGFQVSPEGRPVSKDLPGAALSVGNLWEAPEDIEPSKSNASKRLLPDASAAGLNAGSTLPPHAEGGKYNSLVAYALLLNCMMGVGIFGLPHAFWHAGAPLAIFMGIFLLIVNVLTCLWVLEVMARTQGVMHSKAHHTFIPKNTIDYEKYDLGKMSHVFGGTAGRLTCQIVIIAYCFGCMWACAAVFGSSTAQLIFELIGGNTCDVYFKPSSSCSATYLIAIVFYGVIVIALTLLDYGYQLVIQLFLSVYRFIGFLLMLVTIIYALITSGPLTLSTSMGNEGEGGPEDMWAAHWDGFYLAFTGMAYVFVVQYNMPDILTPVRSKKNLRGLMIFIIFTVAIVTVSVGLLCAWFFNGSIEPLCILNWRFFTGLGPSGWSEGDRTWFAWLTYIIILLFPVVDLVSIFPLVAVTMSDNLIHSLPSSLIAAYPSKTKVLSRIIVVIPPLICAMVEHDLTYVFMFSGLPAFLIQCIIPCVLQLLSCRYFQSVYAGKDQTPYSHAVFSNQITVAVIVIAGLVVLLVSALCSLVPILL
ncbi:Transmembrane protein [Pelomyxa schiedti]|nr:Transmembrane protein [Pelomyxa schiedti]